MTLFHISSQQHPVDDNGDGFLDMPLFTTYNILQRWNYTDLNGITGQLAVQYVNDKKDGGTLIQSLPTSYLYETNGDLLRVNGKTGICFF